MPAGVMPCSFPHGLGPCHICLHLELRGARRLFIPAHRDLARLDLRPNPIGHVAERPTFGPKNAFGETLLSEGEKSLGYRLPDAERAVVPTRPNRDGARWRLGLRVCAR